MRHVGAALFALLAVALIAGVLSVRVDSVRAVEGEITGDVPRQGGFGLVVWGGGSTAQLQAAASYGGCAIVSVWATAAGDFIGSIYGAPAFVNARFNERFANGVMPANTAVVIVCVAATPLPRPTGTATATATLTATPVPTPTTVRFNTADNGSVTETGDHTGIFGIVFADAEAGFNISGRMQVIAMIPNIGSLENPVAVARLWNDFRVGGPVAQVGQAVTAQFNVEVSWSGHLAGAGAAGAGASIDIRVTVLDRADGNRQVASRLLHSKELRDAALTAGGFADRGSESADFTAQLIRGRQYRLQVTSTCEATSGLLATLAACGFGPVKYVGLINTTGSVEWISASVTYP